MTEDVMRNGTAPEEEERSLDESALVAAFEAALSGSTERFDGVPVIVVDPWP
jgi:hypothetical protein